MSGGTGATSARTARYVPGAGNVVLRGDVLVALPYAPAERSAAVWDALDGAAGVMDALQVLSSTFDAGLAALPPFAVVVQTSGGRAHVLVRGDVEVHVDGRDGSTELHGRDVSTWTERAVEGVDGVRVRLGASPVASTSGDGDAAPPATLPLVGGVVRAKAVTWGSPTWAQDVLGASAGASAASADAPEPEPALEPEAVPEAEPEPEASAGGDGDDDAGSAAGAAEPGPGDVPQAAPGLVTAVPGLPAFVPTAPSTPADPVGSVVGTVEVPSELTLAPMETIAPGGDRAAEPASDVPVPDLPVPAGSGEGTADDAGDDYQALWETTIHRSVEEAAVRLDESDEAAEGSGGAAPPDGAGLVSGVPQDLPAAPAASGAGDAPDGFDHDGQTVMGSSVADLRAVAAAAAAQLAASGELPAFSAPAAAPPGPPAASGTAVEQPVVGPQLVARLCVSGHANPPSRERCSVCGLALSGQTQPVARPALGRVRVTTGPGDDGAETTVFPLDRPLVVGRRPRSPKGANQGGDGALHRIVTVPSPQQDISRSHVEVRLEGWNVLAVDLNTTNGTTLLRPGQSPLRMHPGDPLLVVSGDVVDLGDGVTLAFEDVP